MRKREKSIIEPVKGLPTAFNEHLDRLNEGDSIQSSPFRYRHLENGEEFAHLAGAIAWPGEKMPGYILIIGVQCQGESDVPHFLCLEEAESQHIEGLLNRAVSLRERYGFRTTRNLFSFWYGDQVRFAPLLPQFNQRLQDEHEPEGVNIIAPIDFQQPNPFELYLHRTHSLLSNKSLDLGECKSLKNALLNLPPDAATRYSVDDCPPAAALGYAVHSILVTKPWTWRESTPETTPSDSFEEFERYVLSQQGKA